MASNMAPYAAIVCSSKKGFNYLALETDDEASATFVIYSQKTKAIKAAINVRYNALLGKNAQEAQVC